MITNAVLAQNSMDIKYTHTHTHPVNTFFLPLQNSVVVSIMVGSHLSWLSCSIILIILVEPFILFTINCTQVVME